MDIVSYLVAFFVGGLLSTFEMVEAIDCYKCTSIDGATEECEDKFDIGMSTVHFIQRSCQYGYFKGTHCIKFKGERDGTKITVRDCSNSDWGSHCGGIRYQYDGATEQMIYGCLEACAHDGCNTARQRAPLLPLVLMLALFTH
ncbi:uncharacterized protein LOC129924631 isoform X2 [Biomphalaria glabrata]|uniref:Uncharacterized protein LOC129924631 isoform X2 n=1 Tax=Biomphalaria glabrata TaxID=6526 RepID=A0A9W2ZPM3_BIOGL|nr:uncharacterized protein LOC129924631 isoform X2 [Biomphalaria glabrata]